MPAFDPHAPQPGAIVGGKYRVLDLLGKGGMGTVYRGQNLLTGKEVALKWMNAGIALSSDAGARLQREAQAACRLSHPNVVNVFDLVYEGETLFMVMELLHGETLRSYLARNKRPPLASFLELIIPAIDAVAEAHARGVIHRDLKPDNIFLVRPSGSLPTTVKVLDFGVAKVSSIDGDSLTRTGTMLGTPLYMSLEQLRGEKSLDHRTDVYAFGVILYEAVTGRVPYLASTLAELAIQQATQPPACISQLRADVPAGLARAIEQAIARERDQRLPDLHSLIRELQPFARPAAYGGNQNDPAPAPPAPSTAETAAPLATPALVETAFTTTRGDSVSPSAPRSAGSAPRAVRLVWLAAASMLGLIGWLAYQRFDADKPAVVPGTAVAAEPHVVVPGPVPRHREGAGLSRDNAAHTGASRASPHGSGAQRSAQAPLDRVDTRHAHRTESAGVARRADGAERTAEAEHPIRGAPLAIGAEPSSIRDDRPADDAEHADDVPRDAKPRATESATSHAHAALPRADRTGSSNPTPARPRSTPARGSHPHVVERALPAQPHPTERTNGTHVTERTNGTQVSASASSSPKSAARAGAGDSVQRVDTVERELESLGGRL